MRNLRSRAFLLAALVIAACGRVEQSNAALSVRDSAGVAVAEVPAALITRAPVWVVSTTPLLRLGEANDASPSQYYRITGVHLLPNGRVIFASDASKQIFTIDATGNAVDTRGRQGRGPLEFLHVQMLKSSDTGAVPLFDALQRRVTLLTSTSAAPEVLSLAALGVGALQPLVRFANGHLLGRVPGPWPAPAAVGVVRGIDSLVRVDPEGHIVARYGAHAADDRVLRLNADGGLTGGQPPYRRKLLADADDSTVVVAASGTWELRIYSALSGTMRIVRVDKPRRLVDDGMRRQYRERVLRDVRDDYGIREWTMLSNDDVFPAELPAFDLLLVDRKGAIWVRETVTLADTVAEWTVFDRAGSPVGRARLPAGFTPFDITRDRIAGVWLDSLGGEQVQVWALTRR